MNSSFDNVVYIVNLLKDGKIVVKYNEVLILYEI